MNPPVRHFATELKIARECAGMTQEQLAKACNYSKSVVAMVETLQRPPTKDFADRVDKALATGGRFDRIRRDLLVPEVDPSWFRPWRDHEQEATEIRWYEPLLVPGLLQTAAYAKALLEDDDRVASRLERQDVLDRAGVYAVIEEGVLYRKLGDSAVMHEQLTALATTTRAVVRVLARDADTRRRYDGSFALATVDGTGVGYVDTPARIRGDGPWRSIQLEAALGGASGRSAAPKPLTGDDLEGGGRAVEERGKLTWRKSSRSGSNGGGCVEVATLRGAMLVRDSKDPAGPVLAITSDQWQAFLAELR